MDLRKWIVFWGATVLLFIGSSVHADLIAPRDSVDPGVKELPEDWVGLRLDIKYDRQAGCARLQIPRAAIDLGAFDGVPRTEAKSASRLRTITAGVAMSLAFVGLFFIWRTRGVVRPIAAVIVGVAVVIGAASTLWANGVFPEDPNASLRRAPPLAGNGLVIVEVVERGDAITLILSGDPPVRGKNVPLP